MRDVNLAFALLGGLTVALSLGASLLQSKGYLPQETILATAVGVAVGPHGLGLFDLSAADPPLAILEQLARVTAAIAVTSIGLRLPATYVPKRALSLAVLLGPVMIAMWLVSGLLTALLLSVPLWVGLLVGAVITPTDPVLASTIVTGSTAEEHIPQRLRYLVSAESGANDGVAYFFVWLALFALGHDGDQSPVEWVAATLGWEVLGAVAVGFGIGAAVGRTERWLRSVDAMEDTSVFTLTVALTIFVLGFVKLLGTDGILAVFVAALAYNWQAASRDEQREGEMQEVFNRLFTVPVFVLFGAVVPIGEWVALGWRALALVAAVLLLRRLPAMIAAAPAVAPLDRRAATLFVGWFGPIGVAALFYGALAARETGTDLPWVLASLVVAGSILAHGATATAFTHWYGRLGDDAEWW